MKHLLLFVLIASCLALLPGAALAADSWAVVSQDIPAVMTSGQVGNVAIEASNDGTTTWDTTYGMSSVITSPVLALSNRWGMSSVALAGAVAPGVHNFFDFSIVAPPIVTLAYPAGATPTSVATVTALPNAFTLYAGTPTTFVTTDLADATTSIMAFTDIGPDQTIAAKKAFAFQIEEMAGHVPFITAGYAADNTYRATGTLTRGALSAFLQRALKLPLPTVYTLTFTDMTSATPFWKEIQALVGTGIVGGFQSDNTFRPTNTVTRGQMAQFLVKSVLKGEAIPSGPATPSFTDVATSYNFYNAIEYGRAHDLLSGYSDNTYRATNPVTRGQMASFLYRGFIGPTPCVVVLGGPAVTKVDPASAVGVPSAPFVAPSDTAYAYVLLDAMRLGTSLVGPDTTLDVTFVFGSDTVPTQTVVAQLDASDITTAHDAAALSGSPYLPVSVAVPALTAGDYTLSVEVSDENDDVFPVNKTFDFTVGNPPGVGGEPTWITAAWGYDDALDILGGAVDDSTISTGYTEDAMAAKDGTYFRSQRNTFPADDDWCNWNHAHALVWNNIPSSASSMTIKLTYRTEEGILDCCTQWGTLGDWELPSPTPPEYAYPVPLGWGLRAIGGTNKWRNQWWDTIDDSNPAELEPDASGTPLLPAVNDVQCGYTGHPTTDTDFTWTTNNVADYVTDGRLLLVFCGGGYQYLYVDQAVLTWTP